MSARTQHGPPTRTWNVLQLPRAVSGQVDAAPPRGVHDDELRFTPGARETREVLRSTAHWAPPFTSICPEQREGATDDACPSRSIAPLCRRRPPASLCAGASHDPQSTAASPHEPYER